MKRAVILALLISGCATVALQEMTTPPADWPALRVIEHRTPFVERTTACGGSVGRTIVALFLPIPVPLGCAFVDFAKGTCDVWLPEEPDDTIDPHELAHCRGSDHPGKTYFRDLWEKFKASRQ